MKASAVASTAIVDGLPNLECLLQLEFRFQIFLSEIFEVGSVVLSSAGPPP
jgi:hypothetical protein